MDAVDFDAGSAYALGYDNTSPSGEDSEIASSTFSNMIHSPPLHPLFDSRHGFNASVPVHESTDRKVSIVSASRNIMPSPQADAGASWAIGWDYDWDSSGNGHGSGYM